MNNSIKQALIGLIAIALMIISVSLIPFSREKELSNLCREYYAINQNLSDYSSRDKLSKIKVIANKTGLKTNKSNIIDFCNSFYFNQK